MFNKRYVCIVLFLFPCIGVAETDVKIFENPSMGIGIWFGGEKVATNPDGDDYKAGGGAILDIGSSYQLFDELGIANRNSIAYRFQGAKSGKGENSGVVLESSLSKAWNKIGFGAGIHIDLFNQISDKDGKITKFKNSIGPVIHAEWIVYENIRFALKYLIMNYEAEDGIPYKGNQVGFFMQLKL